MSTTADREDRVLERIDKFRQRRPRLLDDVVTLAHGAGGTTVSDEPYVAKSRSREQTFQRDVSDRAALDEVVAELAHRVAEDVADEGRPALRVAVKVRFAPFFTHTRSVSLGDPTPHSASVGRSPITATQLWRVSR